MEAVEQLASWLRSASTGVVFTGAGISTESGIPDFRSPGGVWSREKPVMYDDFMRSRDERVRYWRVREEIYRDTIKAKPNAGHDVVAELQRLGHVSVVITQNIDGLHQDAGADPVIELHGTNRIIACQTCHAEFEPETILERIRQGEDAPDCHQCGGPLKSKTISFGQAMPQKEMEDAVRYCASADICLAMGSSLVVEPAASLPRIARQRGARLVIINHTETPQDAEADLVIREGIGSTLEAVLAMIKQS
ncbi:MAG: SIR2 family NAD-dependent protein deacylase [Phycisphaerae bacterium]